MRDTLHLFGILAILAVGMYSALTLTRMEARSGPIDEPVALEGDIKMGPDYVDCWMYEAPPGSGNKASKCVFTYCGPRETEEACEARHEAKVARLQLQYPPCGTPPMAPMGGR